MKLGVHYDLTSQSIRNNGIDSNHWHTTKCVTQRTSSMRCNFKVQGKENTINKGRKAEKQGDEMLPRSTAAVWLVISRWALAVIHFFKFPPSDRRALLWALRRRVGWRASDEAVVNGDCANEPQAEVLNAAYWPLSWNAADQHRRPKQSLVSKGEDEHGCVSASHRSPVSIHYRLPLRDFLQQNWIQLMRKHNNSAHAKQSHSSKHINNPLILAMLLNHTHAPQRMNT